MKKVSIPIGLVLLAVLLALLVAPATASEASIVLLNPPPNGLLQLDVGESYTLDVQVTSDDPYIYVMGLTDAYYPGRGVWWQGNDIAHHGTSAMLHFTVTGKNSTANLVGVCDWPEPGDCDWPDGAALLSLAVGARYKGGVVSYERFNFAVEVP
ncbi:MAG: hypothetical protein PVF47_00785 [Anaerolineae bacterium]|jgi:hypothetical protein